jgi:hypothetical protein
MKQIVLNEITGLTPTKTNIDVVSKEMTESIINGEVDPIEFSVRLQFAIDTLTECLKIAKPYALKSIDKETTMLGAKLEVAESGVKYDYSANHQWQEIEAKLEPLLKEKKTIEERIKMATKIGNSILDEYSGEIIASPVAKISTTVLKITLGK